MATSGGPQRRSRGYIRQRGNSLTVQVFAGEDPVTGKKVYLTESTTKGQREAERIRTRLLAQADRQRQAESKANFGYVLDAWLTTHEVDPSTLASYKRSVEKRIKPALGSVALANITPRVLEAFYAELRRCRDRCDRKPFIEHRTAEPHDCEATEGRSRKRCRPHKCLPYAAGTIRETHSIISGAMAAAVRWEWVTSNPADVAKTPKQPRPQPLPPSSTEASRIIASAAEADLAWGMFVWLAMITGARRGELCALRWHDIDLGRRVVEIRRNWVDGVEKQTKTHQIRRISIDEMTTAMLAAHRERYRQQMLSLELEAEDSAFLFSYRPDFSRPCDPDAISHRYTAMCAKLGITSHLHALRHYSATELISAGVDVRTVAGRLGHGGGGTTTLRVYTAWVAESDTRAAELLARRMTGREDT